MNEFIIAAAQISVIPGNIAENLKIHINAAHKAHAKGVKFLVFPELSLTGYEPELASDLALEVGSAVLHPLAVLAQEKGMTLVVGAPITGEGLPYVGALVFGSDGSLNCYRKMFLHVGEEVYFSAGDRYLVTEIQEQRVLHAICADTSYAEHVGAVVEQSATIYAAGVLVSVAGYPADTALMQGYAAQHRVLAVMANYCGVTGGWNAAGGSAVWSEKGLLARAGAETEGMVLASFEKGKWAGRYVAF